VYLKFIYYFHFIFQPSSVKQLSTAGFYQQVILFTFGTPLNTRQIYQQQHTSIQQQAIFSK
jgi:hypothetical protein